MGFVNSIQGALAAAADVAMSLIKIVVLSRRTGSYRGLAPSSRELVVLGNGPSLRRLLDGHRGFLDGKEVELNGKSGAYLTTLSGALEKLGDGWAADFGKTLQENSRLFGKNPRYVMAVAMGERSLKKASFFAPVPPIALASICVILSASAFSYGNDLPTYVYFLGSLFIGLLFSGWLHFHSVIGAEQALPFFDHYAWIILLAVNLVCFGLYFALPPLGSVILLALLALVDLGLGAYRIYVLSNLGKLVEVPS